MFRQFHEEQAYAFFGGPVPSEDLLIDTSFARAFAQPEAIDWLARVCHSIGVTVRR